MEKKRFTHYLRENKRESSFTEFVFFDTESSVIERERRIDVPLRLGVAVYVRQRNNQNPTEKWLTFRSAEEFVNFLLSCLHGKNTLHVISHNIHHDISVLNLINRLCEHNFRVKSMYLNGLTAIIRLTNGTQHIVLEDGTNRLRGSIRKWGEILGIPKLDVHDFNDTPDDELEKYCKRDVEILYKAHMHYFDFVRTNNMGNLAYTLAGQAFNAYRHRFMKIPILIHDNQEALRLERLAYGGGRVSTFKVGSFSGEEFYYLDVNSMYPFVMRNYPYPTKLLDIQKNVRLSHLEKLLQEFAIVGVFVVNPRKPVLRRRTKEYILYPCYRAVFALSTPEIEYCLQNSYIEEVREIAIYEKSHIFTDYVDEIYEMRRHYKQVGNVVYSEICKLLLNSLYGRFGLKSREIVNITDQIETDIPVDEIVAFGTKILRSVYRLGNDYFTEIEKGEGNDSFPAIAAHTTAYARMYLFRLIEQAGLENTYYTDTDSLIVNSIGYQNLQNLIDPFQLGCLKLEDVATELTIYARKDYVFGDIIKRKGIPYSATQIDDSTFERIVFPKLRSTSSKMNWDYHLIRQTVKLQRRCFDGIPDNNGNVHPFTSPLPHLDPDPMRLWE